VGIRGEKSNSNVLVTTSKQKESSYITSSSEFIPENLMNSENSPAVRSSAQQFCSGNNDVKNALNTSNSCRLTGERETIKSLKANRTNSTATKKRERQRVSIESDQSISKLHVSKLSSPDSNSIPDPDFNYNPDPDPDPNTDTVPGPDLEPDSNSVSNSVSDF